MADNEYGPAVEGVKEALRLLGVTEVVSLGKNKYKLKSGLVGYYTPKFNAIFLPLVAEDFPDRQTLKEYNFETTTDGISS